MGLSDCTVIGRFVNGLAGVEHRCSFSMCRLEPGRQAATGTRKSSLSGRCFLIATIVFLTIAPELSLAGTSVTLKLSHVGHDLTPMHTGAVRFDKHLQAVSGGEMSVEIFPRGVLGNTPELWVQMQTGILDMQSIDFGAISMMKQAAPAIVTLVPFLFRDQEHLRKYFKSEVFESLASMIKEETGIRFLGAVSERAPRVVSTTKRPVKTIEDMKGLRVRVPGAPMFQDIFKEWGAVPVAINPGEMFMALKSGMVEGEDNGVITLSGGRNSQVIKHFTTLNWHRGAVALWIGEMSWQRLSEQQRAWVHKAALLTNIESQDKYEADLASAFEKLETLGITVHEPELDGFYSAREAMVEKHEGKLWPEGEVARIRAIQ